MTDTPPGISWLASYPKSGNTWVRFLLIQLLHGSQRDTSDFQGLVPDIHEELDPSRWVGRDRLIVKSHLLLHDRMPWFARTERYIYLVRHPLDVLVSNLNYVFLANYDRLSALDEAGRQAVARRYIDDYIDHAGDPRWVGFGMGTWVQNVESWTSNAFNIPGITLRYESLLVDTHAEVARICAFLELSVTPAEVDRAVAASSFERMRAIEEREIRQRQRGFFYQENFRSAHSNGFRFMNRGQAGQRAHKLSAEQIERAERAFDPLMQRLGYRDSTSSATRVRV